MDTSALREQIQLTTAQASSHWPVIAAWLTEPLPGAGQAELRSLEVGFQTGTEADQYPVDVPPALDHEQPWFWIGFVRTAGDERAAVVFWFAPTESLQALRQLPEWDSGNALGFDFLARNDEEMRSTLEQDLARQVLDVFGALTPAEIEHGPA